MSNAQCTSVTFDARSSRCHRGEAGDVGAAFAAGEDGVEPRDLQCRPETVLVAGSYRPKRYSVWSDPDWVTTSIAANFAGWFW